MGGPMLRLAGLIVAIHTAATALAAAETPEQRQACTDDAFQYCGDAIPDRDRVFNCLIEKRAQLSPLCVAGIAPYLPATPVPAAAKQPAKGTTSAAKTKPAAKPTTKPLALSPTGR